MRLRYAFAAAVALLLSAALLAQVPPSPKRAKRRADSKCVFLREESERTRLLADEFERTSSFAGASLSARINGGTPLSEVIAFLTDREVWKARLSVLRLKHSACLAGVPLSAATLMAQVEEARKRHLPEIQQHWLAIAGDQAANSFDDIRNKVNAVYDQEARSFYQTNEIGKGADPDVVKDYPSLLTAIGNSALPDEQKRALRALAPFLRYEEAGRLFNVLSGTIKDEGLGYAYLLRRPLEDRSRLAAESEARKNSEEAARAQQAADTQREVLRNYMSLVVIVGIVALVLAVLAWPFVSLSRAKFKAFKTGARRVPFLAGCAELVLWEPGETVLILQHKQMRPMPDDAGGYCIISPFRGEEYKGRVTSKTQFMTWQSEAIHTSDGLAIRVSLGIWWRIAAPRLYVSKIASDYHSEGKHRDETLGEAAEFWVKQMAAGTLREHINKLPAEKLISPYVLVFIQVAEGKSEKALPQFSELIVEACGHLSQKTQRYGIEIERIEVQELVLPTQYQEKLEAVRVAFLEPAQARAEGDARRIAAAADSDSRVQALEGLVSVIGKDRTGLIEILRSVDLSKVMAAPAFITAAPVLHPFVSALNASIAPGLASAPHEKQLPPGPKPDIHEVRPEDERDKTEKNQR
jgi:regulator of protease activity HflC (stomatin/prohibitin superfamily)